MKPNTKLVQFQIVEGQVPAVLFGLFEDGTLCKFDHVSGKWVPLFPDPNQHDGGPGNNSSIPGNTNTPV